MHYLVVWLNHSIIVFSCYNLLLHLWRSIFCLEIILECSYPLTNSTPHTCLTICRTQGLLFLHWFLITVAIYFIRFYVLLGVYPFSCIVRKNLVSLVCNISSGIMFHFFLWWLSPMWNLVSYVCFLCISSLSLHGFLLQMGHNCREIGLHAGIWRSSVDSFHFQHPGM